jgi:glycogen(starch) synthase
MLSLPQMGIHPMVASGARTFSVIINTIERSNPLHTLLRSLEHQSYPHFEVIVVAGPTKDNSLEMLSEYAGRVRLLHCPTTNLSQSRNIGLLASRGDIVVYIDDDAVPCQRWLEQYARIFQNPGIQVTGGAVWAAHPKYCTLQFRQGIYSSLAEQHDVRSSWIDEIVPNGMGVRWIARAPGGNLASRREILLDIYGFDEFYEFVAEETDLALRLTSTGISVSPVRQAVIYHFPASGPNRVVFTNKGRWWMRSRSRVYLGLRHGPASGDSLKAIILRSLRSAGAHIPWYVSLVFSRELSAFDFLGATAREISSGANALVHGLFSSPRLIDPAAAQSAKTISEPILMFQNEASPRQPTVDPVTGRQPQISLPEPPLRVCLLSYAYPPDTYGGIARLTNLMAQGLFETGHTVHVITQGAREEVSFYDGAYVHKIPSTLRRYEQYRQYYNLHATLNYSHDVYDKVRQLILNDGIQIVDSPLWQYEGLVTLTSGLIPVVVRLVTGLRQITDLHKSRVEEFSLMGDLEQVFLHKAHHLLPNTQATLDAIQSKYHLKVGKPPCTIIPYGILPAADGQIRPFQLQSIHEQLTILFVGRLEKRKGILDLFKAIPEVLKQVPNARFVIAGGDNSKSDGFLLKNGMDYPSYFAEHYRDYLLHVQFTGPVEDEHLQNLYQSCDLFVAPSLYESFGLVYLEAMNFAKPVIGCRVGGIPEVIEHGITGLLTEPEAPKALAEAIVSMLKSPHKLNEMGLAGRSLVLQRFNYIQMARNFAQVYRQTIQAFAEQKP